MKLFTDQSELNVLAAGCISVNVAEQLCDKSALVSRCITFLVKWNKNVVCA